MRITLAAVLVLASAASLGAQTLTITPPTPLTNTRYGSEAIPAAMRVASNGRTFVAVWQAAGFVRAARVNPDGSTNIGVPVANGLRRPAIAAFGDGYVIAAANSQGAVKLRFLDENGRPVSPLSDVIAYAINPQLAANGSTIALVGFSPPNYNLFLLDRDGRVKSQRPLTFGVADVAIASNGAGFELIVSDGSNVYLQSVDAEGNLGPHVTLQSTPPRLGLIVQVAIASDGDGYLTAWNADNGTLNAARIDAAGHVGASTVIATPSEGEARRPRLAWSGGKYACGYLDGGGHDDTYVYGSPRFLEIDAQSMQVTQRPVTAAASLDVGVAATNDRWLAAWSETRPWRVPLSFGDLTSGAVRGAIVSGDTTSLPFVVSTAASEQWAPAAASNGSSTFVAWLEATDERTSLMTGIIGPDQSWRELGAVPNLQDDSSKVRVASDGSGYLLTWGKSALRFEASGARIDSTPIALPFAVDDVAWDGRAYIIVGETAQALAAATISPAGAVGAMHVLRQSGFGDAAGSAHIATSGDGSLVSYIRAVGFFPSIPTSATVMAIDRDLAPRGAEMTLAEYDASDTDVVWNGSEYLVVICRSQTVVSSRISRDGALIDAAPRVIFTHTSSLPSGANVAVTNGGYVLVWSFPPDDFFHPGRWGYAALLRADGTVASAAPFESDLSSGPTIISRPGGGNDILASSFRTAAPFYAASRVETYRVGDIPVVPAPPSLSVKLAEGSKYTLEWTSVAGSTGYRLEYRQDGDEWQEIESWFSPTLPSITLNIQGPARFDFRVRALGSGGPSRYSNEVSLNNRSRHRAAR